MIICISMNLPSRADVSPMRDESLQNLCKEFTRLSETSLAQDCLNYINNSYAMPYHTIPYYTILYHTVLYRTVRYCTILHCTIRYYTILFHSRIFRSSAINNEISKHINIINLYMYIYIYIYTYMIFRSSAILWCRLLLEASQRGALRNHSPLRPVLNNSQFWDSRTFKEHL